MALSHYGVLNGTPTHFRNSWTANNHYQLKIDTHGDFFRIAVNVRSKKFPHNLYYQIVDGFSHPILSSLELKSME